MLKIQSSFPLHVFQAAPNILSKISPTFIKIAAVALAAISTLFLAFIFYHDCQKYIKLQARLLAQKEIEQNEQEKELQEQENEQMLLKLQKKEQQEVDEKKKDRNEGSDQGHTNPQINIPQKTNNPQTNKVQNTWQIGNSLLNPVDPMKEKRKKEEEESLKLALSLEKEEEELQRVISISQLENASPTQQNKGSTTQVDPNTNIPLTLGQQGLKTDSRPTTTQLNTAQLSFHGNGQTTQTLKVDTSLTNSLVSQSLGCTVNDPKDSQEAGDVKDLYPKTNFNQQAIDKGSEISTSSSSSGQTQKNIDPTPLNSSSSGQTQNKTSFILHSLSGSGQTQKNIDSLLIDSLLIGSSSTQTIQTVKIDNSHTKNQVSKSLGCLVGNPNVFTNLLSIVNTKSQGAVDVNDLYSKTTFDQKAISNGGKIPSFIVLPGVFRNKAHWFETGEAIYSYHDILKNNDAEDVPLIVIKGLQINRVNDSKDYLAKAFLNRQITDMFPLKGKNVPLFPKDGVCDCFWFIVNDKDDIIMDLKDAQPRYGSHRYTQTEVDPCIEENEKEMSRLIDFLVKNAKGEDDPSISSSSSGQTQTQKQTDPTSLNSISSGQTQKQTDLFPSPPVIKIKDPFDIKSGLSIDTKSSSPSVGGSLLTQSNPNGNGQTIQTVNIDNSHIKNQQSMSLGCALEGTKVFQNLFGAINNHSQGKVDVKDLYTKTCFDQQAISNGCKIPNFIAIQSVNRNKAHWHEIGECLHSYFDILKNNHAANVPLIVVKGMQINRFKNPDHLTKCFLKREHADTIPINNKNVPFFPINSVSDCFWFVVNDTDNVIMNRKDAIPRYGNSRYPDNEVDHYIEENKKEMSRLIDFLATKTNATSTSTNTSTTNTNTNTSTTNTNVINSSNTTQGKTNAELLEELLKDL